MAGARAWSEDGVLVTVGGGSGLTSGAASPSFRLVLGVSYKRNPNRARTPRVRVEHEDQIDLLQFYEVLPAGGDALKATDLSPAARGVPGPDVPSITPTNEPTLTAADVHAAFQAAARSRLPVQIPARVYFSANTTALDDEAVAALQMILKALESTPDTRILVQGYADNLGADDINLRVSLQRARAARDWLVKHAQNPDAMVQRIDVIGMGAERPLETEITLSGRTRNRRVEFVVKPQ